MTEQALPTHMKALWLQGYNKNYELRDDVPVPRPKTGEVLVCMAASGFCHTDFQVIQGVYKLGLPITGSHEPAGAIAALGEGVTAWNAVRQVGLKKGDSMAIIGIGGLGVLAIQFAKELGYQVVAIDNRDNGLKLASEVPSHLRPDLIVKFSDENAVEEISELTRGIGLHGAVVCTDDVEASDWALHRLRPRAIPNYVIFGPSPLAVLFLKSEAKAKMKAQVQNQISDAAKNKLDIIAKFVEEECIPADPVIEAQLGQGDSRWTHSPLIEKLKDRARTLGLWNMFLPQGHYDESPGWTNLEYGLMAE
ncbi:hypothetical protein ACJZ2D_014700 [Fusarium nematophilum]